MSRTINKLGTLLKRILTDLVDLVYPPLCLICEQSLAADEDQLCRQCLAGFTLIGHPHQHFSVPGEIFIDTAWALFEFDPPFQDLIHQLKYARRRQPVLRVLDCYASQILDQLKGHNYDLVISIPLHPRKYRERGYNQVDDLSRWLADHLGAAVGNRWVARSKYTRTQTQLNAAERQTNVAGAFLVNDLTAVKGKHILLVDDVLTTGATANSLAQALRAAAVTTVDLLTLSTPKSLPDKGNPVDTMH